MIASNLTRCVCAMTLGLYSLGALADGLTEVQEKGTLRVAVYQDFPPYSYTEGGRMIGVDVDIARRLAEKLGVGLGLMRVTASDESMEDDLRNAIWKGHYLGGGTADVMMHVPVDEGFAEENDQVLIFNPYYQEEVVVGHRLSEIPALRNLLIFSGDNRVAVELETIADMYLTRVEGGRLMNNIRRFKQLTDACQALLDGAVQGFMAPQGQVEHCIGDSDAFAVSPVPVRVGLFGWTVGMATKTEFTGLATALEAALDGFRTDGTLEAIFSDHGLSYKSPPLQVD